MFTEGSLNQLKSVGFKVLYFPYESIVNAFKGVGIDVEFDELTPDEDFLKCLQAIDSLDEATFNMLKSNFVNEKQALFLNSCMNYPLCSTVS